MVIRMVIRRVIVGFFHSKKCLTFLQTYMIKSILCAKLMTISPN